MQMILRDGNFAVTMLLVGIATTVNVFYVYIHILYTVTLLFDYSCGNYPDHSQSNEEPSVTWITTITRINVQRVTSRS